MRLPWQKKWPPSQVLWYIYPRPWEEYRIDCLFEERRRADRRHSNRVSNYSGLLLFVISIFLGLAWQTHTWWVILAVGLALGPFVSWISRKIAWAGREHYRSVVLYSVATSGPCLCTTPKMHQAICEDSLCLAHPQPKVNTA